MRNQVKTWILLGTLSAIFITLGGMIGESYMVAFTIMALAMNFGTYWFSDRIVLTLHRAREIAPDDSPLLHSMAEELAHSAGIPKPRLCRIDDEQPNAFATGRNPEKAVVAVTSGLLRYMPALELRGILAHEMAHIRNRDTLIVSVAAAIAGTISYAAQALSFADLFGPHSDEAESHGEGLLMLLAIPLIGSMLQMAVSRSREYLADETAAKLTGDPGGLAGALRRLEQYAQRVAPHQLQPATASLYIVNPFSGADTLMSLFSTHPATCMRIMRLEGMRFQWPATRCAA
jgi:heat shock protein HtpX